MSVSIREWLSAYQRGEVPLEVFRARVRSMCDADTAQLGRWVAEVQAELAAGRISEQIGRSVLDMLTSSSSETQVDVRRAAEADETMMRTRAVGSQPEHAATVRIDRPPPADERTLRMPVNEQASDRTLQIDPPAPADERTSRMSLNEQGADRTLQIEPPTPADERTLRMSANDHASDRTLRIDPTNDETAARPAGTLRRPVSGTLVRPEGYEAGESRDRTQIITERLVKSLDDASAPHTGPLQTGSVVKNRFVLEKLIGKGGMGLVFCALDRRKLEAEDPNPRVAFKVLNADFQRHPQAFIALQREARKAQTLAHPNVVTVFDFDRDGDAVYMTMELLQGRPLEGLVREVRGKGVPPKVALPIIRGIAEGLAYAHRKGIVHSDLKPGNVFVVEDGTPKILDFGIARATPNASPSELQDTFDAGVLGAYTEAYATEEMVAGTDPHPSDDLYALGIIAYELLTGFHPYQRQSAAKARQEGIKPPPLKGLKLREARALERCLSFDRKQRPQNAQEFLKAFRGVTALQKASLAAAVVLAMSSGYFYYQNYRETGPSIPFSALPVQIQEDFKAEMKEGDTEWQFFVTESNPEALNGALKHYATAYSLHERNRDAVKALNKVAEAWLEATKDQPELRRVVAENLLQHSEYYRRYPPVMDAVR